MENNLPVITKRVWRILCVAFFMLREGLSKGKLMMDLNIMLKRRGKLAGKAIADLMFHHHHHETSSAASRDPGLQLSTAREYEFSCSNTPKYSFFQKRHHHRRSHNHNHFFACAQAPLTQDEDVVVFNNALKVALETLDNKGVAEASPAVPGFGRSPMVRQLRVTDSPFLAQDADEDRDHLVDKAAEDFIKKFYEDLRKEA